MGRQELQGSPTLLLLLILFGKVILFSLVLIFNELCKGYLLTLLFTFTLFVLCLVIQCKQIIFEPLTVQKKLR